MAVIDGFVVETISLVATRNLSLFYSTLFPLFCGSVSFFSWSLIVYLNDDTVSPPLSSNLTFTFTTFAVGEWTILSDTRPSLVSAAPDIPVRASRDCFGECFSCS